MFKLVIEVPIKIILRLKHKPDEAVVKQAYSNTSREISVVITVNFRISNSLIVY